MLSLLRRPLLRRVATLPSSSSSSSSSSAPRLARFLCNHSVSKMDTLLQRSTSGAAYVVAPELTWTGATFEKNVHVHVAADGAIERVEANAASASDAVALPGYALLPGMVNAHSHAFQRGLRGLGETYAKGDAQSSFWTWREEMYKLVGGMTDDRIYELTRQCFQEMRDAGITSVGEFHYFHHDADGKQFAYDEKILQAAKDVGIRIVLLNAYYEHGGFKRAPMTAPQKRFKTDSLEKYWNNMDALHKKLESEPTQSIGVVAHSMRAVEMADLVKLHNESVKRGLVFHIHLEEQVLNWISTRP
jgi:formimidoylglutamate deiminase